MVKFVLINGWVPLFLLVVRPLFPYPFMNFMTVTFFKKSSVEKSLNLFKKIGKNTKPLKRQKQKSRSKFTS